MLGESANIRIQTTSAERSTPPPKEAEKRANSNFGQENSSLDTILVLEKELRGLTTKEELRFHFLNESRRTIGFRQAFYIETSKRIELVGVSSVAVVEKNAPLVRWICSILSNLEKDQGLSNAVLFDLPAYAGGDAELGAQYPFVHMLWQPLLDRHGRTYAGVLFAKERIWQRSERDLVAYLSGVYSHAMTAFDKRTRKIPAFKKKPLIWAMVTTLALALFFVEVPMTTTAPAEVVAADPFIVAAPLNGAIEEILVPPNSVVTSGTALVKFHDTEFRNRFGIAERELAVAEAMDKKTRQNALIAPTGNGDIAVTKTEIMLKQANLDYARDMLEQTILRAERDGMVVYADPDSWAGRPVAIGERIMEVVDTTKLKVRLEVPIDDSIALREGAVARIFLHADPLNWLEARVTYAGVQAKPTPAGPLAYIVEAEFIHPTPATRIGFRGTAQLFGDRVSLYFFLFRRPLSAIRQAFGI